MRHVRCVYNQGSYIKTLMIFTKTISKMQKCGKNEEPPAEKMRVGETKRVKERERGRESGDEKRLLE